MKTVKNKVESIFFIGMTVITKSQGKEHNIIGFVPCSFRKTCLKYQHGNCDTDGNWIVLDTDDRTENTWCYVNLELPLRKEGEEWIT